MAQAVTEVSNFRNRVNGLTDAMRAIETMLAIVEDFGPDDAARVAFFQNSFGLDTDHPDITSAEFFAGVVAVRNLRIAWNTNKLAIAKLRR